MTKSSSTKRGVVKGGELHASVIRLNHLRTRESPSHVSLSIIRDGDNGKPSSPCCTGPPLSRHKDGENSFIFCTSSDTTTATTTATTDNNALLIKTKTLQELHSAQCVLQVVYNQNPQWNLQATFDVKDLVVNSQSSNLKLELQKSGQGDKAKPDKANNNKEEAPSIELQVQLRGSLRREMQRIVNATHYWFALMDALERTSYKFLPSSTRTGSWIMPALIVAMLLSPFVAGFLVLLLPFFFPFMALFVTTGACLAAAFVVVLASTSRGRQYTKPLLDRWTSSPSGQALLYPIGPRLTPVSFLKHTILPSSQNKWGRLILSIIIDIIGCSSYLMPFFGEASDVVWAPLQTLLIMGLYDTTSPKLKYLSFAEEILPWTDIIPSATIGWAAQFIFGGHGDNNAKEKSN